MDSAEAEQIGRDVGDCIFNAVKKLDFIKIFEGETHFKVSELRDSKGESGIKGSLKGLVDNFVGLPPEPLERINHMIDRFFEGEFQEAKTRDIKYPKAGILTSSASHFVEDLHDEIRWEILRQLTDCACKRD